MNMLKRYMHFGFSFSTGGYPRLHLRKLTPPDSSQLHSPNVDNLEAGIALPENQASQQVTSEPQAAPQLPPISTFNGTVVRSGERFALRLAGGALCPFDSTGRAWPFEGEDVQVTGNLDDATRMIHIIAIQNADQVIEDSEFDSRMTA